MKSFDRTNAQLEMVEAQKKRQDAEVELVIQMSDGTRLDGKFKPNVTLLSIIQQLCPNELTGEDLFAIYMRTEVASNQLESTSLKDLGLICGRAIIRLVHRDPQAAKIQGNVALNLQPKQNEVKNESNEEKPKTEELKAGESQDREQKVRKFEEDPKKSDLSSFLKQEIEKKERELAELEQKSNDPSEGSEQMDTMTSSTEKEEKMDVCTPEPSSKVEDIVEEDEDPGEIHILGDRNAVLFIQDATKAANFSDLPDSFFDLNVSDIKLLIKDLRSQAEGTIEQPLMTAKLREMEEEQKQLSVLNRYKTVIIRIQFPNRYVLQGTFTPYETIDAVIEFVRPYLSNSDIDFHLYTTPPKSILPRESKLFEANCVPSAILHFGSEEKSANLLKEDVLSKISSPKASLIQALSDRGIKQAPNMSNRSSGNENSPSTSQQARKPSSTSNFSSASKAPVSGDAKLPKWFKPFGK